MLLFRRKKKKEREGKIGKILYKKFKHIEVKQFKVMSAKGTLIQPSARAPQDTHVKSIYCNRLQYTDIKELLQFFRENISLHL